PLVILREHPIDLGLLQHDLGHEDVIRVVGRAPREVATICAIPREQQAPEPLAKRRRRESGRRHPPLSFHARPSARRSSIYRSVKIYTKTGDAGETSLFDNTRVSKAHDRVDAYGEVDELNACLGVVRARLSDADLVADLTQIQNDLFALGSELADPSKRIAE